MTVDRQDFLFLVAAFQLVVVVVDAAATGTENAGTEWREAVAVRPYQMAMLRSGPTDNVEPQTGAVVLEQVPLVPDASFQSNPVGDGTVDPGTAGTAAASPDRPLAEFERAGYGYVRRRGRTHHNHHQPSYHVQARPVYHPRVTYQQATQVPTYYAVPAYEIFSYQQPPASVPQQPKPSYQAPSQPSYQQPAYQPVQHQPQQHHQSYPQPSYQQPAPQPVQQMVLYQPSYPQPTTYRQPPQPKPHPQPHPHPQPQPQPQYQPAPYIPHHHHIVTHYETSYPMPSYPQPSYDEYSCPAVSDNFCYGREAGHYGHPGSGDCFVQCDHVGRAFAMQCAYGTSWRGGHTNEPAYANMCT